jgi:hypothetical protein
LPGSDEATEMIRVPGKGLHAGGIHGFSLHTKQVTGLSMTNHASPARSGKRRIVGKHRIEQHLRTCATFLQCR